MLGMYVMGEDEMTHAGNYHLGSMKTTEKTLGSNV